MIMSDCARINNYVPLESLIVKSEMKIEMSENESLLSIKNEDSFAFYDRCYILHDPFPEQSTSRSIKMENNYDSSCFDQELMSNPKNLILKNVESLHESAENVKKPIKSFDKSIQTSFFDIADNFDSTRSNSNYLLEIIDLNDQISEKEVISFSDVELSMQENSKGKVDKLLFENINESVMNFAMEMENIPVSCPSFLSRSCNTKPKKERVFVLKRHRKIVENTNIDFSQIKLKDLINAEPFLPAPKSRVNYKLLKNSMKLKAKSEKSQQNKRTTNEYRIDPDERRRKRRRRHIVKNEMCGDNTGGPIIDQMEANLMNYADIKSTSRSFRVRKLSGKRWNSEEQENFYKALMVTGTDFTRMATIFPRRSRDDLKKKFKVEEKKNPKLIEQILRNRVTYNVSLLKLDSHLASEKQKKS